MFPSWLQPPHPIRSRKYPKSIPNPLVISNHILPTWLSGVRSTSMHCVLYAGTSYHWAPHSCTDPGHLVSQRPCVYSYWVWLWHPPSTREWAVSGPASTAAGSLKAVADAWNMDWWRPSTDRYRRGCRLTELCIFWWFGCSDENDRALRVKFQSYKKIRIKNKWEMKINHLNFGDRISWRSVSVQTL